jgi:DNA polymerase III subunit beta
MKCSVETLKAAWRQVSGICPSRTPKEIYQYVRIDIGDGVFALSATDGEVFVTVGDCSEPVFSRLLPVKAFSKLLDACTDEQIGFAGNVIKCGDDTWELQSPPIDDWLFNGVPATGRDYRVDCDQMQRGLSISVLSVDTESTRYALGGVLFDFIESDTLALVATDSRRLSICEVDCECDGEPDHDVKAVVPLKTLKLLLGVIGTEGEMSFAYGLTGGIVFHTSAAVIHSPLVQGQFPQWQRVVPDSGGQLFRFPAGAMGAVLKSASITTSEESRGLNLHITVDGVTATSKAADVGRSRITRQLQFTGEAEMSVNPEYLLPVFNKLGADCELTLNYTDAESALMFSHDGGFRYVLMPLAQ